MTGAPKRVTNTLLPEAQAREKRNHPHTLRLSTFVTAALEILWLPPAQSKKVVIN